MTLMKKFKTVIPFLILFLLLSMLWRELYSAGSNRYSSSMAGESLPRFSLTTLSNKTLSSQSLHGRVVLLNVFATWCSACNAEHDMMMRIKNDYHVPVYGILYRDNANQAIQWLNRKGNPYVSVGNDPSGRTGVELGIYGTPETFVISPQGRILYRHSGVISQRVWDNTIYPIIKQYEE